jgi:hypothetical protein
MRRWLLLPERGTLLVSTDLHGNGDDFRALRDRYLALRQSDPHACWAILGDLVHAPDETARQRLPELYGYADESLGIVEGVLELQAAYPGQVFFVLGNHDHGHVGGPHTRKFHPDEVAHLEGQIGNDGVRSLRRLFEPALLALVAPCGVLLAHGSPDDALRTLEDLNDVELSPARNDTYHAHLLDSFLNSYGQSEDVTARLLARLSEHGPPLALVIHGHDRDESGFFTEGGNQLCPVIFGAPRQNKRYVVLQLGARYAGPDDVRDGVEIRRLYA